MEATVLANGADHFFDVFDSNRSIALSPAVLGLLLARGLRTLLPINYRAILAKDVAHALIRAVHAGTPGVVTLLSGEMQGG